MRAGELGIDIWEQPNDILGGDCLRLGGSAAHIGECQQLFLSVGLPLRETRDEEIVVAGPVEQEQPNGQTRFNRF